MVAAPITIRIRESNQVIKNRMLKALGREVLLRTVSRQRAIATEVGNLLIDKIADHPVWQSIENGSLREDLGIPYDFDIGNILEEWGASVQVNIRGLSGSFDLNNTGIQIVAIRSDFADVLNLPVASYISPPSGSRINWLEWVLLQGSSALVDDFIVSRRLSTIGAAASRTTALMIESPGASFRIPPFAAGDLNNNFVVRAIKDSEAQIALIVKRNLER